jgi:hypothetical protein
MGLQRKGNRMKPKHTVLYCKQQFQLEFRSWTYRTHPVALRIPYRAYRAYGSRIVTSGVHGDS